MPDFPSTAWRTVLVLAGLQLTITIVFVLAGGFVLRPANLPEAGSWRAWLAGMGLAMALATGVYWLVAWRRLVLPLQQFAALAAELGRGDYRQSGRLRALPSPWAPLAVALDEMAGQWSARERMLGEGAARLNAILASLREGVLATDPEGRVMLANDAAWRLLSRSREDLVGQRLLDTVRYRALRTAIEEAQRMKTPQSVELETLEFRGPRRVLQASVTVPAEPAAGGVAIVIHDLTDARQMETMRRDFVANVSHELKTPLAAIRACAETLRTGALHDESVNLDFVVRIENQAQTLGRQIQRLLDLSRAQSGGAAPDIQPVDLGEACHRTAGEFSVEAEARGLRLEVDPGEAAVCASADPDALRTVISNLISNAVRYTPAGGRVEVRARRRADHAVVEVSDTGPGIAPEHQARIFERYYRVDRARSRDQGGSGLGLAIVRHLVQAMGGSVELESEAGRGSVFRIVLPSCEGTPDRPRGAGGTG